MIELLQTGVGPGPAVHSANILARRVGCLGNPHKAQYSPPPSATCGNSSPRDRSPRYPQSGRLGWPQDASSAFARSQRRPPAPCAARSARRDGTPSCSVLVPRAVLPRNILFRYRKVATDLS
eukprot:5178395-Pleurochrysis_carterae.AAC.1